MDAGDDETAAFEEAVQRELARLRASTAAPPPEVRRAREAALPAAPVGAHPSRLQALEGGVRGGGGGGGGLLPVEPAPDAARAARAARAGAYAAALDAQASAARQLRVAEAATDGGGGSGGGWLPPLNALASGPRPRRLGHGGGATLP